jgi:hypothetical protein
MYLFNNLKFDHTCQRTIGDVQYPAGWFTDPAEREKIGVTEVPDPVRPDDNLFTSVENPDGSYTATPRTAADIEQIKQSALNNLRYPRDRKLQACDYTQLSDVPLPIGKREAWATYRQQLRDYMGAVIDPFNPPAWPIPPQA